MFALLKSPYVISTEAMQSIAKWRNLLKTDSSTPPSAALGMTPTMFSTEH